MPPPYIKKQNLLLVRKHNYLNHNVSKSVFKKMADVLHYELKNNQVNNYFTDDGSVYICKVIHSKTLPILLYLYQYHLENSLSF